MKHDVCPWNKSQEHEEDAIKRRGYSGGTKVGKRREKWVDAGFYILAECPVKVAVNVGVHPEEESVKHEKCTGHDEDDSGKFFHNDILPILPDAGILALPPFFCFWKCPKFIIKNPDDRNSLIFYHVGRFPSEHVFPNIKIAVEKALAV